MKELFDLSFTPENLLPTILLTFVAVYWLVFLVGLLDLSFLDFSLDKDLDLDLDVDIDMDADLDGDLDADKDVSKGASASSYSPGFGTRILLFLNLGDVPIMAFMTFFSLFFWGGAILSHYYWSKDSLLLSILATLGSAIVAAFLTKAITQPFRKFFRALNADEKPINLTGQIGRVEIGTSGDRLGQADVFVQERHLLINIKSEGGGRMDRGIQCLILAKDKSGDFYYAQPFEIE